MGSASAARRAPDELNWRESIGSRRLFRRCVALPRTLALHLSAASAGNCGFHDLPCYPTCQQQKSEKYEETSHHAYRAAVLPVPHVTLAVPTAEVLRQAHQRTPGSLTRSLTDRGENPQHSNYLASVMFLHWRRHDDCHSCLPDLRCAHRRLLGPAFLSRPPASPR
jgi:hypothetical protein